MSFYRPFRCPEPESVQLEAQIWWLSRYRRVKGVGASEKKRTVTSILSAEEIGGGASDAQRVEATGNETRS